MKREERQDIPLKPLPPALWPALTSGVDANCFAIVKLSAAMVKRNVLMMPNCQLAADRMRSAKVLSKDGLHQ